MDGQPLTLLAQTRSGSPSPFFVLFFFPFKNMRFAFKRACSTVVLLSKANARVPTSRDGSKLAFRFEMWHERLLAAAHAHGEPDAVEERPAVDNDHLAVDNLAGDGDSSGRSGTGVDGNRG